jgi:hypothetical protein
MILFVLEILYPIVMQAKDTADYNLNSRLVRSTEVD